MPTLAQSRSEASKKAWIKIRAKRDQKAPAPAKPKAKLTPHKKIVLPPESKTVSAKDMMLQTTVFCVTFHGIGNRRQVESEEFQTVEGGNKKLFNTTKKLMECDELDDINSLYGLLKRKVTALALPFHLKDGIYLMPRSFQDDLETILEDGVKQLDELVGKMVKRLPQIIATAKTRLSKVKVGDKVKNYFNPDEYMNGAELRGAFQIKWRHLFVDSAEGLSKKVHEKEKARAEAEWAETRENIKSLLRGQLRGLVDHLVERLTPNEHNEPKSFRAASIDNFVGFLDALEARNITHDVQLTAIAGEARKLLDSTNAEQLRTDTSTREYVLEGFENIQTVLDSMIGNKPHRSIKLID